VWAEVCIRALEANLRDIRRYLDAGASHNNGGQKEKTCEARRRVRILAVVKGDAYGHGAIGAGKVFAKAGADWFGGACSAKGAELRENGIRKPILVLTGYWDGEEQHLVEFDLTPAVSNCRQLIRLERAALRAARRRRGALNVHLKIDSGMHRLGIPADSIDCV